MRRRAIMAAIAAAVLQLGGLSAGEAADAAAPGQWLMMVKTVNTDPTKEREFNAWYDDIDIPDVLKVPGYMRARRGRTIPYAPELPTDAHPEKGHYVALYNIESPAIDKTIIDMLMATWKMLSVGRDTPLLKVTERTYYHQYSAPFATAGAHRTGASFLVLERFDVSARVDATRFDGWYNAAYRKAAGNVPGVVRATRYELYRVLMFEPKSAPRYLTVYEISADSKEQARHAADLIAGTDKEGAGQGYVAGGATLYAGIKDVLREGAPARP